MRKIIAIDVKAYIIICTLDNNEKYKYDMSFIKSEDQDMLRPLKDMNFFKRVFLEYGSLAWPNGYDIHVDTIIREGVKVEDAA